MSSFGSISSLDNGTNIGVAATPSFSDYGLNQATVVLGPMSGFQAVAGSPHKVQYTGAAAINAELKYLATFISSTTGGTVGFRLSKNGTVGESKDAVALNASYCQVTNNSNFVQTAVGIAQVALVQNDIISLSIQDESNYQPVLTNSSYSLTISGL